MRAGVLSKDAVLDLVGAIYDAAVEQGRWSSVMERIDDAVGGRVLFGISAPATVFRACCRRASIPPACTICLAGRRAILCCRSASAGRRARSHLSKIFDKTGVSRQAELVRLLMQK